MPNTNVPDVPAGKDKRNFLTKWLADMRSAADNAETELDNAGVERKQLDEEGMEALRGTLAELLPGVEADVIDAVIQAVADAVIIPDEVEEEIVEAAMDDEDEEKSGELLELAKEVTAMAKDYTNVYEDMKVLTDATVEVIKEVQLVVTNTNTQTKEYNDVQTRLKALEDEISSKPRRASQSPATEVDPESDIGKQMKARTFEPPAAFADMFNNNGGA